MKKLTLFLLMILPALASAQTIIDKKIAGQVVFSKDQSFKVGGSLIVRAYNDAQAIVAMAETKIAKATMPQLFLLGPNNLLDRNKEWLAPFYLQVFFKGEQVLNTGEKSVVEKQSKIHGPFKGGERHLTLVLE